VPNLAIDSSGSGSVVQVREGARVVKREIKLGVRGAARSQVLAGLKPGERVITSDYTGFEKADRIILEK
jgi:multidrug efflux pump subunit AcrA (membrane-fusion protein)